MKNRSFLFVLFLFVSLVTHAQDHDTTYTAYDTAYTQVDTTSYADDDDYAEAHESSNSNATFTITDPKQLPATQKNNAIDYSKKDFDKAKWKEIVGETTYSEKKIEERKEKERSYKPAPAWSGSILKIIGFALIFAIAIVVLFLLVRSTFSAEFVNKSFNKSDPLLFDHHIEEVSDQDIDSLLKRALAQNDFRAAVRLHYIRLLKHLHSTHFIAWKKDKTNRDYSYELSATPLITGFQKITLAYEVIWYGERTPTAKEFETLQRNFGELHNLSVSMLS